MSNASQRHTSRVRRHKRVRKSIVGTAARPRLAVFRSNKHLVMQVIDDETGRTLAAASTHEAAVKAEGGTATDSQNIIKPADPNQRVEVNPILIILVVAGVGTLLWMIMQQNRKKPQPPRNFR